MVDYKFATATTAMATKNVCKSGQNCMPYHIRWQAKPCKGLMGFELIILLIGFY